MTAKLANATQALALKLREGEPILRYDALNGDYSGTPVEFGRTWFAGDRVTVDDPAGLTKSRAERRCNAVVPSVPYHRYKQGLSTGLNPL